jgi:hypothetical protein
MTMLAASRISERSLGKMSTTSVRRSISRLTRSNVCLKRGRSSAAQRRLLLPPGVSECFAQEVDAAALPGAAEHLGDRLLQLPGVRVGDQETALVGESPLSRLWVVCRIAAM